jgi:DNA-binding GntR family transcriptional regulator
VRRLKREPIENKATDELRRAILSGSLAPGSRLRQEKLASQLGVSRMPVRQAFVALEREGLVRTDPWRGTIVAPLERSTIEDIYTLRGIIEQHAASTLATSRDFDVTELREIVRAGQAALAGQAELATLIDLDLRFHTCQYEALGNGLLVDIMRHQWAHLRRVMGITLALSGYVDRAFHEHVAILKAIETHNAARAGSLAHAHTTAALKAVMKDFKPSHDGE